MTAQPGDEPGNVVAWKDFKTELDEDSTISRTFGDFRHNSSKCVKPDQVLFFSSVLM